MINKWTITLEEDRLTGEILLPFPEDLLSQMGWHEGTELLWLNNDDGSYTITEKKNEPSEKR